ncbi:BnaA02g33280D [Brassica napus]|uniref:BnaA02g33280D protein n=1 Tax=Brassica napus TaxID=3708 RepID=A0A078GYX5_BRANA|nr:BnaA02g33280D [Brassica napus]
MSEPSPVSDPYAHIGIPHLTPPR